MKAVVQKALETTLLTLGSAVLFAVFFHFNDWIFSELTYTKGVNWIFLPAGFRIILVLILGLPGAVGITLGTWYLDGVNFFEEIDPIFLNGIVSGMTPYLLMKFLAKGQPPFTLLQGLTTQRLLNFTLLFAAANAITHNVLWLFEDQNDLNIWVDVWPMFIGDAIGALMMMYAFKLLLSRFKLKTF